MKTKIFDKANHRTITVDHALESISIIGDCSSSSITTYWVVNKFNLYHPECICITFERAKCMCDYYNRKNSTDTFIVSSRSIFV